MDRRKAICGADRKGTELNKKRVLAITMALIMALGLSACGSGSEANNSSAGGDTPAASADDGAEASSVTTDAGAAETVADTEASSESTDGSVTQEYEFTKTSTEEELESPITAAGLVYDESEDRSDEHSLTQERESFHLHIGVLSQGYGMDEYMATSQADNATYATDVSRGHNIQQADAANSDGSARFTVIRYTNFEDGGENDYQYMGNLAYTDGTSTAATEFIYAIDKEYGNGEEVEAAMRAITQYYGIDYDSLEWVDVES